MKVRVSYTTTKDGMPEADHTGNLKRVSPLRRFVGFFAVDTYARQVARLNRRAYEAAETNPEAVVLDLGTGDSKLLHYLNGKIRSTRLHAIDAIDNGDPAVKTFVGNLEDRFPVGDNAYDVVLSSFNIEHIIDVPQYLSEMHRALKPGGYALILTENLASWVNIGALVFGWLPFSMTSMFGRPFGNPFVWHAELYDEQMNEGAYERKLWGVLGHQRVLTLRAYVELFERHGFRLGKRRASPGEADGGYAFSGGFGPKTHSHFIGFKVRKS